MKRVTTVLVAGALGALLLLPAAGGAQTPGATTLTYYEPDAQSTFKLLDQAPKSPVANPMSRRFRFSVGDQLLLSSPLYDRRGGTRQGTVYIVGTVVKGRTFSSVLVDARASYVLTSGDQITAQGVFSFTTTASIPITGGTGAYAGARGSLSSVSAATSSTDTLTLLP